jgi:hypothetical protein
LPSGSPLAPRLPDFIIGGAPKCGTSSLHAMLACSPDIGIPDGELHFFDADDPATHPDFFRRRKGSLEVFDPDDRGGPLFRGYAARFEPFRERRLIGEDSTTYLFSPAACARIKRLLPDTKLIFMLRDPVARAYSQYWHQVASGRLTGSFEQAIVESPAIVGRSSYLRPLSHYLDVFGANKVKVILCEDLAKDSQAVIDEAADFLQIDRFVVPRERAWVNRAAYPARPGLTLAINRVGRRISPWRYRTLLNVRSGPKDRALSGIEWTWRKAASLLLTQRAAPPMQPPTRDYLSRHLSESNRGLSQLLGRDLSSVWESFSEG